MDFIYKYTDNNDGIIKYVGRSKRKLDCRVSEHENLDDWVKVGNWKIEYFKVPNQSYSESIESHLIAYYGTHRWYNKAKKNWGIIYDYLKYDFPWKLYSDNGLVLNLPYDTLPILEDKTINNNIVLVTDRELSLDFEVPIEEIWKAVGNSSIQPIAQTEKEELLFYEDSVEKLFNYFNTYVEKER